MWIKKHVNSFKLSAEKTSCTSVFYVMYEGAQLWSQHHLWLWQIPVAWPILNQSVVSSAPVLCTSLSCVAVILRCCYHEEEANSAAFTLFVNAAVHERYVPRYPIAPKSGQIDGSEQTHGKNNYEGSRSCLHGTDFHLVAFVTVRTNICIAPNRPWDASVEVSTNLDCCFRRALCVHAISWSRLLGQSE